MSYNKPQHPNRLKKNSSHAGVTAVGIGIYFGAKRLGVFSSNKDKLDKDLDTEFTKQDTERKQASEFRKTLTKKFAKLDTVLKTKIKHAKSLGDTELLEQLKKSRRALIRTKASLTQSINDAHETASDNRKANLKTLKKSLKKLQTTLETIGTAGTTATKNRKAERKKLKTALATLNNNLALPLHSANQANLQLTASNKDLLARNERLFDLTQTKRDIDKEVFELIVAIVMCDDIPKQRYDGSHTYKQIPVQQDRYNAIHGRLTDLITKLNLIRSPKGKNHRVKEAIKYLADPQGARLNGFVLERASNNYYKFLRTAAENYYYKRAEPRKPGRVNSGMPRKKPGKSKKKGAKRKKSTKKNSIEN